MSAKLSNEARIGLLVVIVIGILLVLTWKSGNMSFIPNGYSLKVRFQDVQGLDKNAPVMLNGFEEGRVRDIQIIYGDVPQVELTLWLKSEARVPQNAKAYIRMMGFMGEKYVALEMKDAKGGYLTEGALIAGEEPASFEKLLGEGTIIAKNIREITDEVNDHLKLNKDSINEILANLRVTSKNLNSITTNVDERLAVNSVHIDQMIYNLDSASRNLDEMSEDLKRNPWKLLFKAKEVKKEPIPTQTDPAIKPVPMTKASDKTTPVL